MPRLRLRQCARVLGRFFPWIWASILLLLSGCWILFAVLGSVATAGLQVHLMQDLGILMMLLFGHVHFALFGRLRKALAAEDWSAGGAALGQVRAIVGTNLLLGLTVVVVGAAGRYLYPWARERELQEAGVQGWLMPAQAAASGRSDLGCEKWR